MNNYHHIPIRKKTMLTHTIHMPIMTTDVQETAEAVDLLIS